MTLENTDKPKTVANDGDTPAQQSITLGYLVGERKLRKTDFNAFLEICRRNAVKCLPIDMNEKLEDQGPYDVLLHHTSDLMGKRRNGDQTARDHLDRLKKYVNRHPETLILDPLTSVRKLNHRYKTYCMIRQKLAFEDIQVPPFVMIRDNYDMERRRITVRENGLSYPLLAKPARSDVHEMQVIFNEKGLCAIQNLPFPLVLQQFIPHRGVLYKVYIIGKTYHTLVRPSLATLRPDSKRCNRPFHTWDVSKPGCASELNPHKDVIAKNNKMPDLKKVKKLVDRISEMTKLSLLGVDLILEQPTDRHYLIDVNYFPGYDGVPEVGDKLYRHVVTAFNKHKDAGPPTAAGSTVVGVGGGKASCSPPRTTPAGPMTPADDDDRAPSTASERTLTERMNAEPAAAGGASVLSSFAAEGAKATAQPAAATRTNRQPGRD